MKVKQAHLWNKFKITVIYIHLVSSIVSSILLIFILCWTISYIATLVKNSRPTIAAYWVAFHFAPMYLLVLRILFFRVRHVLKASWQVLHADLSLCLSLIPCLRLCSFKQKQCSFKSSLLILPKIKNGCRGFCTLQSCLATYGLIAFSGVCNLMFVY